MSFSDATRSSMFQGWSSVLTIMDIISTILVTLMLVILSYDQKRYILKINVNILVWGQFNLS